jgi:hypothetical protein
MLRYQDDLIANFRANASEPLTRCLKALETGVFIDLKGRVMSSGRQGSPLDQPPCSLIFLRFAPFRCRSKSASAWGRQPP